MNGGECGWLTNEFDKSYVYVYISYHIIIYSMLLPFLPAIYITYFLVLPWQLGQAEADEERLKAEEEEGIEVRFGSRWAQTSPHGRLQQDGPKVVTSYIVRVVALLVVTKSKHL